MKTSVVHPTCPFSSSDIFVNFYRTIADKFKGYYVAVESEAFDDF